MLEDLLENDFDNFSKNTFIVTVSATYYIMDKDKNVQVWRLLDQMLLKFYDSVKDDRKSAFQLLNGYSDSIEKLKPAILYTIYEIAKH